jgi:hypothetical protein
MARYRPPTNLPTDPVQLAAVLLEQLRRIGEDLGTIPTDDVNTVIVQERVDVPAGSTRRISPPTTGGTAILESPGPANSGKKATIIIENPAGSLKVVASPHRAADGKITASTINDSAQATYTLPGVVTFTSNGVDSWKTQVEAPAETAPSTTTAGLLEALEGTFHVQTADANLPNARVATSSDTIEVDHTTGGQARWNVIPPAYIEVDPKAGGTENAYVLPTTLRTGDVLHWAITGAVTVNGIDATGVDDGFEFTLSQANGGLPDGNQVTIVDESGSASAGNRIGTPDNVSMIMGTGGALRFRRLGDPTTGRWIAVERGFPRASTSIAYGGLSGREVQRAALTGDVTASANSNTTAIAPGVIVDADVNASAAIAQTKLGATTGFSVKASGSAATTSAEPLVMYTASGNTSAGRVTTSSTSVTVSTSVANQIEFQRAALTGAVTASANSNATLFDTNASGAGLTGGGTAVLAVGAGTGIAVNANDVAVDASWAEILVNGNNSGAFNPHIDTGQYIGFGVEASLPVAAAGDIQHSGSLEVDAGVGILLQAGADGNVGDIRLQAGVTTGSIELEAGADVNSAIDLLGGGLITIQSLTGILIDGGPVTVDASAIAMDGPTTFSDDAIFSGPAAFDDTIFKRTAFSTTLAAGTNNLNIGAVSVVRFSLTGSQTLTGMVPTSVGQTIWMFNADSADTLTLAHLSGSSSAANQFLCPNNVNFALPPRCGVALWYDATSSLWFVLST